MFRPIAIFILLAVAAPHAGSEEAGTTNDASVTIRGEFSRLDADGDGRISQPEFLRRQGSQEVLRRDFTLYDSNSNGSLSRSELATVWGLTPPELRGPIPDPFEELVVDAVAALDQSYDHWNRRPNELVNAHTFVANFIGSISHGGKRYVTGRIIQHADQDSDGRLSRGEAKRFLQYQLGVRWHDGPPLREPSGRLVRMDRFLQLDEDANASLSRSEFLAGSPDRKATEEEFSRNDRDRSGSITYHEYAHYSSEKNFFDPIGWFRQADTNLDAALDQSELESATGNRRQHLVASAISAFDDDGDEQLSLREYRLSMLGNFNYTWHVQPADVNRDGFLSYDEFVFHRLDLFQLQRSYYFHRLDQNGDGKLSSDEFSFLSREPYSIHVRSIDGTVSRVIYQSAQHPRCGWPSLSPDGTQILFHRDVTRQQGSRETVETRIVSMNLRGENLRELCNGSHPCWSPGGDRFVCVRNIDDGVAEVWIMDADGRSGNRLAKGRAPRWSPDGALIAYQQANGVWLYDIAEKKTRQILRREDHHYQDLGDDIVWSPDSKRVAFLGNRGPSSELVLMSANPGPRLRGMPHAQRPRRYVQPPQRSQMNWSTRDGIVLASTTRDGVPYLMSLDPERRFAMSAIKSFELSGAWKSACVTPDNQWYIAVSTK